MIGDIAVLDRDKCDGCQEKEGCKLSCVLLDKGDDGRPIISEDVCLGCGDCVKECPKGAIRMVKEECIEGMKET